MEKRGEWLIRLSRSIIFCLIIFSGCATKEAVKNSGDEEILRERVTAYWNHKINGEFEKSYEYESPLYRKQVSVMRYVSGFDTPSKVKWVGTGIESVAIDGDSANVNLRVRLSINTGNPDRKIGPETFESEQWVKVEGVWYHVPQRLK